MSEPPNTPNLPMNLLSEFFHELISRVLPGLVVLALYAHKFLAKSFTTFHDSWVIFSLSVLTLAWLIGLTVDLVVFGLGVFGLLLLRSKELRASLVEPRYQGSTEIERMRFRKAMGERGMFRSTAAIGFVSIWLPPPNLFSAKEWMFEWNRCYGGAAFAVFFLLWLWACFSTLSDGKKENLPVKEWRRWFGVAAFLVFCLFLARFLILPDVKVYSTLPLGAHSITNLTATFSMQSPEQNAHEKQLIAELKRQAAGVGANGVVIGKEETNGTLTILNGQAIFVR